MERVKQAISEPGKISNPFVVEIERLINDSDQTQSDLAHAIGYANPNLITMFKRGVTRVPEDKVIPLANALKADPNNLMRLWAQTYTPALLAAFEDIMGTTPISATERSWVRGLRDMFNDAVPMFDPKLVKQPKIKA